MTAPSPAAAGLPAEDVERVARAVSAEQVVVPPCPRCGSPKWVSVSLDTGYTRRAQCVPCGRVHALLGPGWKASR